VAERGEYKIHVAIVEHHRIAFPQVKLIHIPMSFRTSQEAFFANQMGAEKGAHDLMLIWKEEDGTPGVGFFEVKSETGKLSTPQNKFASSVAWYGCKTGMGRSVKDYHNTLISWGLKPACQSVIEPDLRDEKQKLADHFDFYGFGNTKQPQNPWKNPN
jgi:hypothetical protein